MDKLVRQAPLAQAFEAAKGNVVDDGKVKLAPIWPITAVEITVWPEKIQDFCACVQQLDLHIDIEQIHRVARTSMASLLPVGPMKWMLIAKGDLKILDDLRMVIPQDIASIVDQSHGLAGLAIQGEAAKLILSKGCAANINEMLQPNMAGSFGWGHYSTIIYCDRKESYQLFIMRSLAHSFAEQIFDAALPEGYSIG